MNQSIFTPKIQKSFKQQPLSELLSDNIFILEEYDIDINFFSQAVEDPQEQKNLEILYLSLINAVSVLDKEYVNELVSNSQVEVSDMEKQFFETLKKLPELALENMDLPQDIITKESFSKMKSSLGTLNQNFSSTLQNWFDSKKTGLAELLSAALTSANKDQVGTSIVDIITNWRANYVQTKQKKIQEALNNLDKIEEDTFIKNIEQLDFEQIGILLRPALFYSPYYELSQLERVPIELALEVAMLLKESQEDLGPDEMLRLEERSNIYVIEYLKLINAAERDRNILLHALNSFSDFISDNAQEES